MVRKHVSVGCHNYAVQFITVCCGSIVLIVLATIHTLDPEWIGTGNYMPLHVHIIQKHNKLKLLVCLIEYVILSCCMLTRFQSHNRRRHYTTSCYLTQQLGQTSD